MSHLEDITSLTRSREHGRLKTGAVSMVSVAMGCCDPVGLPVRTVTDHRR